MPGPESGNPQPGLACLTGGCLWVYVYDQALPTAGIPTDPKPVGCWCLWCGTASYNPDLIDEHGCTRNFTPTFRVCTRPDFTRTREDMPR